MMFEVQGRFKIQDGWQKFRKIVDAGNERQAMERVYSLLGSNHKVKRNLIKIDGIKVVQ